MVTDAGLRVVVAAATFVVGWGLVGYLWATVAGAVAWLIMLIASPATRAAARLLTPGGTVTFLRGASHSIAAAGASAVLVMGFPVLLKATSGDLGATGGVVILAVTLTRAPLLVPLTAMQGNLIAHFVDQRTRAAAGAGGARRCGDRPWPAGRAARWGVRAMAAAQRVRGRIPGRRRTAGLADRGGNRDRVVDVDRRRGGGGGAAPRVFAGMGVGDGRVGALLLLPLGLETRTVIALLCGPLVGIAVHLGALARMLAMA